MNSKKIAIVYDWIDKWGGVERVLLTLHEIFPAAEFFTSYYDKNKALWANGLNIKSSYINSLPSFIKHSRILSVPFYPYAFESFDFTGYDLVISVTSSFAKSVITRPGTLHICYLLTPTRYLWVCPENYVKNYLSKIIAKPFINPWKKWDYIAAQRPDKIISISETVQTRCKEYYKRESEVIYPPFDVDYWEKIKNVVFCHSHDRVPPSALAVAQGGNLINNGHNANWIPAYAGMTEKRNNKNGFFLVVSRLEPYKKVDLVVDAFNKLPELYLAIVGCGSQLKSLKKRAKKNIEFIEYLEDSELANYYSQAKALIIPQEEDFGYVSLEAQFFCCPVIAYKKGGAVETIVEDKTGIFFDKQNEEDLAKAIARFHTMSYNLKNSTIQFGPKNAEKFTKKIFEKKFIFSLCHPRAPPRSGKYSWGECGDPISMIR